jgi:hypothetical protein
MATRRTHPVLLLLLLLLLLVLLQVFQLRIPKNPDGRNRG